MFSADWILFEAGALSKSLQDAKVIPFLFDLDFSDIGGPIAQFQAKKSDRDGVREAIGSVNACADKPVAEDVLDKRFAALWLSFEEALKKIPNKEISDKSRRTQSQVLEELVGSVRSLENRFRDIVLDGSTLKSYRRRKYHPTILMDILHSDMGGDDGTLVIPAIAGLLREDAPWLAEILLELGRDISNGSTTRRSEAKRKLKRIAHMLESGHPAIRDLMDTKDGYFMLREGLSYIEHRLLSDVDAKSRPISSQKRGSE